MNLEAGVDFLWVGGLGSVCLQGWKWWAHPELPRLGGVRKRGLGLAVSAPGQEACVVEFSFLVLIPHSVTGGDGTCVLSLLEHQRETVPALGSGSVAGEQGGISWDGPFPSPHLLAVVSIGWWTGRGVQEALWTRWPGILSRLAVN